MPKLTVSSPSQLSQLLTDGALNPATHSGNEEVSLELMLFAPLDAIPVHERNHEHHPELFNRLRRPEDAFMECNLEPWMTDWRAALKKVPSSITSVTYNLDHDTFEMSRMEPIRLVQMLAVYIEVRSKGCCRLYVRGCRLLGSQRQFEGTARSFMAMSEEEFERLNEGKKVWPP